MSGRISSDHSRSASRSSQTPRLSQGQAYEPMPRHSFGRTSRTSNPNVFSDEYSLEPIDPDRIERAPSPASISSSTTFRSISHPQKPGGANTTDHENPFGDEARVSTEEPHRSSLPQKGGFGFSANRSSVASSNNTPYAVQRNQSVSSRFSMPRAMSPYTGATGPSHPYAMYPQVGVSRSPSVGSTSTIRQNDRPLGESNGPQHPYAMYPQNVVDEGIDDDVIPVGFPGHNPPYQPPMARRADDVGDIIGPDGHTEPLPPYSRYPTGVVPKPPGAETMADVNPPSEDQNLNSTPRDTRDPPISETSSRALVPEQSGNNDHNEEGHSAAPATGVMAFEEKLKRKGKQTACCGLPVWTLVLVATVMLIGGSIGGAIGGILGQKKAAESEKQSSHQSAGPPIVTVTESAQLDYSSMTSTPTNLKPIPTGQYRVPSVLHNSSQFCVSDHDYKSSWKCMDRPNDFKIFVDGPKGHHSVVFSETTPTATFSYGAQPPFLPKATQSLSMAIDTSETSMGPALFFFSLFDKLVIVPEQEFSSSIAKRSWPEDFNSPSRFLDRKQTAKPGDKPWFCWWNHTMMEFFMYVNESTADTGTSTASLDSEFTAATASAQALAKRGDRWENYPRKIKVEERRDYSPAPDPYCQQMQVMHDGHLEEISSASFKVKEIQPTPTTTSIDTASGAGPTYTATALWASPCYCLSLTE
ncbi:hypothetical protein N7492_008256 [Penicillium capsulatum]|uniref:DUF7820 domain-containing protein n=1 Tax=Penicillium capsulatum TaxID=69766 RepID=A0A9W9HPD3_9EURO|nr:hypothetical protein N7492_008256 [Penicillium capsulatum]KAJ6105665.1 hypothetical protein N7512_009182 [Penicillium capsulatum]